MWLKAAAHDCSFWAFDIAMADTDPVSLWIEGLRQADDVAAHGVWNHFAGRLSELARRRISPSTKRVYDQEDAVQSMFLSVCLGLEEGRFPDLKDREGLWRLMLVITSQKISNRHRFDRQQRRDIRRTASESVFCPGADVDAFADNGLMLSREPTPEFAAEFLETCETLFHGLADPLLEQVVTLRLEGFSNTEISERMDCSRRTVQRRLEIIRRHLSGMEHLSE